MSAWCWYWDELGHRLFLHNITC